MWALINVFDLFYPKRCVGCDDVLIANNTILCENCFLKLDIIPASINDDTEMKRRFYGKLKINFAVALLYFTKDSITQKLLHQLKYKNNQQIGTFFAILLHQHLTNHPILNWIDCMVCIPLHPSKEKDRGYNQLDTFCTKLSELLNVPFYKDYLLKTSKGKTQTKKNIFQRAKVKNEYLINTKYRYIKGKNILLIDDVMTTGSTLQNAGKIIFSQTNNNISILTMAYTR